jgi:hypothetical protein
MNIRKVEADHVPLIPVNDQVERIRREEPKRIPPTPKDEESVPVRANSEREKGRRQEEHPSNGRQTKTGDNDEETTLYRQNGSVQPGHSSNQHKVDLTA